MYSRHKIWTPEEDKIMERFYPHERAADVAVKLDRSVKSIHGRAHFLGLKKSEAFMHSEYSGRTTRMRKLGLDRRFKKGQTPANKGKKWGDWMPPESQKKSLQTTFKLNNKPHNTRSDGDVSIRKDNANGIGYKYIRVSEGEWYPLHRLVWIVLNGMIPKGKVLRCKTADTLNCDPSNWELVDRAEHLAKNSGREEMTDKYMALVLARKDKWLRDELMKYPEVLDLKRTELKLKNEIYERA